MIVYPSSLEAIAAAAGRPLTHARILWQNRGLGLTAASVAVSSETAGGPRDAPLRPDTFEYWEPTAIPATWEIDLGAEYLIDAVGIAAHTIGSTGLAALVTAGVSGDIDTSENLPAFSDASGQADDSPILFLDDLRAVRHLRVTIVKRNLLLYSEQFDDASWGKTDTTITANNAASPDGAMISDLVTEGTAGTAVVTQAVTVPADVSYATSRFVKRGNTDWVLFTTFNGGNGHRAWFNLATGATGTSAAFGTGTITAARAIAYPNGWYRLEMAGTVGSGATSMASVTHSASADNSTTRVNNATRYEWGAQFNRGSTVAEYALTTDGVLSTMPRIASIYIGEALAMERPLYAGHGPITLSRETAHYQALSRGGQFLGQSFRRHGLVGSASFSNLSAAWVRSELDPFIASARGLPYFFAWRPSSFPAELAYVWTREDIRPSNIGRRDLMAVSWNMVGHSDV